MTNEKCRAIIGGLCDERPAGSTANSTKNNLKICEKHLDKLEKMCYHIKVRCGGRDVPCKLNNTKTNYKHLGQFMKWIV